MQLLFGGVKNQKQKSAIKTRFTNVTKQNLKTPNCNWGPTY